MKALAAGDSRRVRGFFKWLAIALVTLVTLTVLAVATFMAIFDVDLGNGIGERTYVVTNVAAAAATTTGRDRLAEPRPAPARAARRRDARRTPASTSAT